MHETSEEVTWWNYAGGAANLLLAQVLIAELGEKIVARNTSLTFREQAGKSGAAIRAALATLCEARRPSREDALRFAEGAKRGRLSKFEACLPERMLQQFWAESALDLEGACRAVDVAHRLAE